MKTTRTFLIATMAVLFMTPALLADVQIGAQLRITPQPRGDLEVYVWPDRGMDGIYYPGENINVNVEVTRDAFLILYNIDTRGHLNILFPASPWEDNFVEAGDVISFPRGWDEYDWTIEGPAGTEYIQAIASEIPIGLPEWPVYMKSVRSNARIAPELRDFYAGNDRYYYIDVVNRNICGRYYDWCATDVATFQVRPYPRYHRVTDWDPWPDVFYGEIYIGWPVGARIYVDGIYIGIAPCRIPRHYVGRRVITCYDGPRLIRRHEVNCFPKRDYYGSNRFHGNRDYVYKKGRWDADDHFRYEKDSDRRNRYRIHDRGASRDDDDDVRWKSSSRETRDDDKKKQDVDRWRDYDLGKSKSKSDSQSEPARVKSADRNGSPDFNIIEQPSNKGTSSKGSSRESDFVIKRDAGSGGSRASTARVESSERTGKKKVEGTVKVASTDNEAPRRDAGASVRESKAKKSSDQTKSAGKSGKPESREKSGKGSSGKRSKGGN